MMALPIELSSIIQAIGADEVKVCDWSTAEPMLDVIPINFYRCRLCQNSSLKKTFMVQHLATSHKSEWKMASIRVKEVMSSNESIQSPKMVISEPEICDQSFRTENVTTDYLANTESITSCQVDELKVSGIRVKERININEDIQSTDIELSKSASHQNSRTEKEMTDGLAHTQYVASSLENVWKITDIRSKQQMNGNSISQYPEIVTSRPDIDDQTSRSEGVTTQNVNLGTVQRYETPNTNRIGRLSTRINHPLFLTASLTEKKTTIGLSELPDLQDLGHEQLISPHVENTLATSEQCNLTNASTVSVGDFVEQPHLSWVTDWAMQARLNLARFTKAAQIQPVSPLKVHVCPHCPSRFTTKKALQKHQDIHNGVLVNCDLCDFTSVWNTSLKKHKQLKHFRENLPLLNCPQCDFKTKNSDNMRRHRRRCTRRDALTVPLVRKTSACSGAIPTFYTCEHCCKTFTTKRAMKKHQDIHNGTLVKCDLCDFTSVWSASIKKHKLLRHFREHLPVLYCPQCDFKTKNSDNLRRHRKIIHQRDNSFPHSGMSENNCNVNPTLNDKLGKDAQSGIHVLRGSDQNHDSARKAFLKSPKLEKNDVYITSNAPVTQYFDIVSGQNNGLPLPAVYQYQI